ncbi:hypothetical protein GCM10007877_19460 [Marinibactrum halimedae]|uniref:Uncharacterized protein n=1 Tax=Marinibactrum halimedae TaxID=1444977 RepID=A0AA37T958_9GAMM|nr:hypothetical protein GCM10007877_19460 [Marinibactrum halimedae]
MMSSVNSNTVSNNKYEMSKRKEENKLWGGSPPHNATDPKTLSLLLISAVTYMINSQ